ncbi:ntf2 and rrm domain containing protein [Niveomyces insectorum RCEF 264]|uniref:Ntf2 and rrm domain containing protein n=1 Tax=Niveomyces insectorum RCEF 264 TaxID=1081102 RepID=A0A167LI85_9HYPO|nr:ntf2 and rrm domain containing protein [Niveomyces insectorum RCEF 264]
MSTNGIGHHEFSSSSMSAGATTDKNNNLSKDEVGWYFVEQYYTTLSKSPNKLHLFYGKKSQFVYGLEAEVANVSVGRQDIQERIQRLDFQDCKVRVSNVDTQASFDNIVIQVIGETSNKSDEPRKFVQTFVLAQQPSGYFVLNDILRYIKEEDEVATEEHEANATDGASIAAAKPEEQPEASGETVESNVPKPLLNTAFVDNKLEEVNTAARESTAAEPNVAENDIESPVPVSTSIQDADPQMAEREVVEEDVKTSEAPKEPSPTPVAARASAPASMLPSSPQSEKPKGTPKPMTWASRAAAAAGSARPAAVVPKPSSTAVVTSSRSAAPAQTSATGTGATPTQSVPAAKLVAAEDTAALAASSGAKETGSEWQTAGADSKRQNRPQSISGPLQDRETTLGYVKYVTEKVDEETLRNHFEKFGPVVYFDINRTKNCAFIEFAAPSGYQAAVAANPHTINDENILVEARRPKAGAYGGSNYNPTRGNLSGRGRSNYEGRNSSQGGSRGGFSGGQGRGRGGSGGATRGRGTSQAAAA